MTLSPIGRLEIKRSIAKNLFRGLLLSIGIHFAILGIYYTHQVLSNDDDAPIVAVRLMKYSELGPPPSITNTEQMPSVGIAVPVVKPSIGVPVPVPDAEVNPEQTIATQKELSEVQGPAVTDATQSSGVVIQQDISIEAEPEPDAFIPVEKVPIPVKQVSPEYPDLARRSGVEGVVWVKILVDKQGKAKKAIIIKSDSEVFNESALQAALQWVFTPAIMNNGPITVWVAIPFRFQLNKQSL